MKQYSMEVAPESSRANREKVSYMMMMVGLSHVSWVSMRRLVGIAPLHGAAHISPQGKIGTIQSDGLVRHRTLSTKWLIPALYFSQRAGLKAKTCNDIFGAKTE
jgi:hypothetical protein